MKLLLTDSGIKNASIRDALVGLLGKPIAESDALCIPTAGYGHPQGSPAGAWRFISGQSPTPMCELGWKSLGVLELTALPSIDKERWVSWVRAADVLLVNGGDALYLNYWMRQSGLADLLPSLPETLWVGLSAGSMVMTPRIGEDFVGWKPPTGDDSALGMVDFSIFPHLDNPACPENTMAAAEKWAAEMPGPAYAIDDQTAIKVTDGAVELISEATGSCSPPPRERPRQLAVTRSMLLVRKSATSEPALGPARARGLRAPADRHLGCQQWRCTISGMIRAHNASFARLARGSDSEWVSIRRYRNVTKSIAWIRREAADGAKCRVSTN